MNKGKLKINDKSIVLWLEIYFLIMGISMKMEKYNEFF